MPAGVYMNSEHHQNTGRSATTNNSGCASLPTDSDPASNQHYSNQKVSSSSFPATSPLSHISSSFPASLPPPPATSTPTSEQPLHPLAPPPNHTHSSDLSHPLATTTQSSHHPFHYHHPSNPFNSLDVFNDNSASISNHTQPPNGTRTPSLHSLHDQNPSSIDKARRPLSSSLSDSSHSHPLLPPPHPPKRLAAQSSAQLSHGHKPSRSGGTPVPENCIAHNTVHCYSSSSSSHCLARSSPPPLTSSSSSHCLARVSPPPLSSPSSPPHVRIPPPPTTRNSATKLLNNNQHNHHTHPNNFEPPLHKHQQPSPTAKDLLLADREGTSGRDRTRDGSTRSLNDQRVSPPSNNTTPEALTSPPTPAPRRERKLSYSKQKQQSPHSPITEEDENVLDEVPPDSHHHQFGQLNHQTLSPSLPSLTPDPVSNSDQFLHLKLWNEYNNSSPVASDQHFQLEQQFKNYNSYTASPEP